MARIFIAAGFLANSISLILRQFFDAPDYLSGFLTGLGLTLMLGGAIPLIIRNLPQKYQRVKAFFSRKP